MKITRSDKNLDPLKKYIRIGEYNKTLAWVKSGKPIFCPNSNRESVLEIAAKTGFFSMVELIVKEWDHQKSLDNSLRHAVHGRHVEISELLILHGAAVNNPRLSLYAVAETYEPQMMELFLRSGVDIQGRDQMAEAILSEAQSMIGVIKRHLGKIPGLDIQLCKALKYFVKEKNMKWVSLCLWMGADPRMKVSEIQTWDKDDDDEEDRSSPIEDASMEQNLEILKMFKVNPKSDDVNNLLKTVYSMISLPLLDYFIGMAAGVNLKDNGGCHLLDHCFRCTYWSGDKFNRIFGWSQLRVIEALISHGARLIPDSNYEYRGIRECLCLISPNEGIRLLRLLKKTTADEVIIKIVNNPKVTGHIGLTKMKLLERIIG